jgi:hypothetical protein
LKRVSVTSASALALVATAFVLTGCGGSSSSPSAASRISPASDSGPLAATSTSNAAVSGCQKAELPAGFAVDQAHTGALTAHTYSASADVQAALEYDQLQTGTRSVFTRHAAGKSSPINAVASCVAMTFASPTQAARFFSSYRDTRDHATSVARKIVAPTAIPGVTTASAYAEKQQSFRGYGITSTKVIEVAGLANRTLFIASVAGHSPSSELANRLLESMGSEA